MFLGSLSRHNEDLERRTLKPSARDSSGSWTYRATALWQISVTAPFYLGDSRRIHPQSVRACQPKDWKRVEERGRGGGGVERERERAHARGRVSESVRKRFGSYFSVFSSTWACPMQIGLSQECCLFCLFCLKSSLWSLDLPCLLATTILDSFSLFYIPNIPPSRDGRPNSLGIGASRSFWLLSAELGWRGVLGLPFLLVSRVLIAVSI